ncbi:hypothetical protein ILUMI_24486 [Ignelater luminosus]|uniref:Reverse transcriptase RNase H-like domain-containing protein n=1 Tax=Ignelater luminosus TaxID=2038154 RepID=A0A8K0CBU8_IGNLU|nr:hypothetical protein ILUMI_24486 [Ignelater luminosus]
MFQPFTVEEIGNVIASTKANAPGPDKITIGSNYGEDKGQVLASFNPAKPIIVQCDESKGAIRYMLQNNKPFSLRSLNNAEIGHTQIEKELLAVQFSCQRLHTYVYSHESVMIFIDHMPLKSIINKPLWKITNNRIRRLKLKLMLCRCVNEQQFYKEKLIEFQNVTANDPVLKQIIGCCKEEWPSSIKSDSKIIFYFKHTVEIEVNDGLIYYNNKLVVPSRLTQNMWSPQRTNLLTMYHLRVTNLNNLQKMGTLLLKLVVFIVYKAMILLRKAVSITKKMLQQEFKIACLPIQTDI